MTRSSDHADPRASSSPGWGPGNDARNPIDRIADALDEVGITDISRGVAAGLVGVFVVIISLPGLVQLLVEPGLYLQTTQGPEVNDEDLPRLGALAPLMRANRRLLAGSERLTDLLGERTLMVEAVRPAVQLVLTGGLGAGTGQVYPASDGWLFYAPDIRYVTGRGFLSPGHLSRRLARADTLTAPPQPDPRVAILDLHRQLSAHGIRLVVMPTPVKPSVEPGRLGAAGKRQPSENVSYAAFVADLEAQDILVFDVADALAEAQRDGVTPLYLKTDTHWRPETVVYVARRLARFLERHVALPEEPQPTLRTSSREVTSEGDTLRLLDLPESQRLFPSETVHVRRVSHPDDQPWRATPDAATLLLGDSFTNMYSVAAMGWGDSAGLAEQLSIELRRPVDRISQNDAGAHASRARLAAALGRRPERLGATRVVVYQFANRELAFGDWKVIDLEPRRPSGRSSFASPESDEVITVRAVIQAIGPIPAPGSVPYKDQIVAVHLTDLVAESGDDLGGTDALVYVWGMRDDTLTAASEWQVGSAVRLDIESWFNVADALDGINRGEVTSSGVQLAPPWWGRLPDTEPSGLR